MGSVVRKNVKEREMVAGVPAKLIKNKMSSIIFLDGKFYQEKDAKVSVLDHGYLYGNGCWTTLMTQNDKLFMLDEHIERLYESAKIIQLDSPWKKSDVRQWIIETFRKNLHIQGRKRIRVGFHRGVGPDIFVESGKPVNRALI